MVIKRNDQFVFYDGQIQAIDKGRMSKFDTIAFHDRDYPDQDIITNELLNELGAFAIDFTNIHSWCHEIPDIDDRSTRLFTIWAEDSITREVIAIVKGHIILHPFAFDPTKDNVEDYYFGNYNEALVAHHISEAKKQISLMEKE